MNQPTTTKRGRPFTTWALSLVCTIAASCASLSTNPSQGPGTFAGLFLQGFEVSAFAACGKGPPTSNNGYWLTPSADFNQRYSALATTRGPNAFGPLVYVRFTGTLSGTGHYGHLGAYQHEIAVKDVIEMTVRENCP